MYEAILSTELTIWPAADGCSLSLLFAKNLLSQLWSMKRPDGYSWRLVLRSIQLSPSSPHEVWVYGNLLPTVQFFVDTTGSRLRAVVGRVRTGEILVVVGFVFDSLLVYCSGVLSRVVWPGLSNRSHIIV